MGVFRFVDNLQFVESFFQFGPCHGGFVALLVTGDTQEGKAVEMPRLVIYVFVMFVVANEGYVSCSAVPALVPISLPDPFSDLFPLIGL